MKKDFTAEISIRWSTGFMTTWRDVFLSCPGSWLRKWLKVATLDYREREILTDLLEYLDFNTERLTGEVKAFPDRLLAEKKRLAKLYVEAIEEKTRIVDLYKTGKNPNGTRVNVRPTEGEVRRAKEKPKEIERELKAFEKTGKDLERSLKRCKENAEIVRERLEVIY